MKRDSLHTTLTKKIMKLTFWKLFTLATAFFIAAAPGARGEPSLKTKKPLVQVAILLDTSNSMDGLIEQAKSQLWSIVNEFIRARRDGRPPTIEVALYEYGNDNLPGQEGFIRLVLPLTD